MKRTLTLTSLFVVAALSLPVLPAAAQQRRGGGGGGGGGRAQAAPRPSGGSGGGGGRTYSAPAYRGAPSGRTYSAPAYRGSSGGRTYAVPQAQPRSSAPRNYGAPQAVPGTAAPRGQGAPQAAPRSGGRTYGSPQAVPRSGGRTYGSPQAVPGTAGPRSYQNGGAYRGGTAVPRPGGPAYGGGRAYVGGGYRGGYHPTMIRPYFSHTYVRPYGWRPYYPYHFVRPYYVFSPWLDLGFGIWCGFPVPYPWVYLGDYQPTVFGTYYTDVQAVPSAPAQTYGGVSFDIQPNDANLYVDGQYVGVVGTFGPSNEPLTLEPGVHRIAIQRDGYRPLEWDITIQPGQVIPYRGVMEPL